MHNGYLHVYRYNDGVYDLLFGPNDMSGPMQRCRFRTCIELADFLAGRLGLIGDAQKELLTQRNSERSGLLPDVWLSDNQRSAFRF